MTRRRGCPLLAGVLLAGVFSCGLTRQPMIDDVEPGSIGRGKPLEGAKLTVTSKEFTEQLILGTIMGIAFQAAGAEVLDRTGIQASVGSREAAASTPTPRTSTPARRGAPTRATASPYTTRTTRWRRCARPTGGTRRPRSSRRS
ncbi:hypothetical protein SHIRM173S_06770 [Streptomyces hirsutus]